MATPLLTATRTLCIMEGDLHVENLEELIRITKIEESKDNHAVFYEKTRSITRLTGLILGEENEYVEALEEELFYQDHLYLHPDFN